MTTDVLIVNQGTSVIKIEEQSRDPHGQFVAGEEYYVVPGEFRKVLVFKGKSFQVIEVGHGEIKESKET